MIAGSKAHLALVLFLVIGMTMYRADFYGYGQGLWSWIIVITWVTPLILARWVMLGLSTVVYAIFHITFYDVMGLGYYRPHTEVALINWAIIFIAWSIGANKSGRHITYGDLR